MVAESALLSFSVDEGESSLKTENMSHLGLCRGTEGRRPHLSTAVPSKPMSNKACLREFKVGVSR